MQGHQRRTPSVPPLPGMGRRVMIRGQEGGQSLGGQAGELEGLGSKEIGS